MTTRAKTTTGEGGPLERAEQSFARVLDATRNAERLIETWVKRGKLSTVDGSRLMNQFLAQARQSQGNMEKMAHVGSRRVVYAVAGTLAHHVEDLRTALSTLSQTLRALERQNAAVRRTVRRRRAAPRSVRKTTRTRVARRKAA